MKHIKKMEQFLDVIIKSKKHHLLILEGPPGVSKSETVEKYLNNTDKDYESIGAYSTPLSFYNSLYENKDKVVVMDDSAGVFNNLHSLSILKAATWSSVGGDGARNITWRTTGTKAIVDNFTFSGKLILLANHLPSGIDIDAFSSRGFHYKIDIDTDAFKEILLEGASSTEHYKNIGRSKEVAQYLIDNIEKTNINKISLRTLSQGYALAESSPEGWRDMLDDILPSSSPEQIAINLSKGGLKRTEQAKKFCTYTGKSERTFYNYVRDNRND